MELTNANISSLIDKRLEALRPQFENLLIASPQMSEKIKDDLCKRITSESKIILGVYIDNLTDMYLKEDLFFSSTTNYNAFWDLKLKEKIRQKYDFSYVTPETRSFAPSVMKIPAVAMGSTIALGGILSVALHSASVIVVSVIVAAVVFFLVKKILEAKIQNRTQVIAQILEELKKQLLEWLSAVDIFFKEEINKLKHGEKQNA